MIRRLTRRQTLRWLGLAAAGMSMPLTAHAARPRVLVVGGGFAGATFARRLKRLNPAVALTLIEPARRYTACPFSNLVVAGLRSLQHQQFGYDALTAEGVKLRHQSASGVDTDRRTVTLDDGSRLPYDRLVLAPGIEMDWAGLPGYDAAAAQRMPHAWQAGAQTLLLRDQLRAMPDGGLVVIAAPDNPYRCPPGPYERASLIAHYLSTRKPRSKLLILDAKDRFSKQPLFQQAWQRLYGDLIEWQGLSAGGRVVAVDPAEMRVETDFDRFQPDVANVIPPQRAGRIARQAGVADGSGWCPVDAVTFESALQPGIHVLGDAAIANAMPKSAFAANAQAKLCAMQVVRLLADQAPISTKLLNTCYSLVAPDYGISVAGVYRPSGTRFAEVPEAGGTSKLDATAATRALEAAYAAGWFSLITREVFG